MNNRKIGKEELFIVCTVIACFSFIAAVCLFFPGVKLTGIDNKYKIDGLFCVFGGNSTLNEQSVNYRFNVLSFVGYLIPLFIVFLCIFSFKRRSKKGFMVLSILLLVSIVLTIFEPQLFRLVNNDCFSELLNTELKYQLSSGPIISIISSCISLFASFIAIYNI